MPRLEHVAEAEKVNLTEDGKKALMTLSNGDMRYAVCSVQYAVQCCKLCRKEF